MQCSGKRNEKVVLGFWKTLRMESGNRKKTKKKFERFFSEFGRYFHCRFHDFFRSCIAEPILDSNTSCEVVNVCKPSLLSLRMHMTLLVCWTPSHRTERLHYSRRKWISICERLNQLNCMHPTYLNAIQVHPVWWWLKMNKTIIIDPRPSVSDLQGIKPFFLFFSFSRSSLKLLLFVPTHSHHNEFPKLSYGDSILRCVDGLTVGFLTSVVNSENLHLVVIFILKTLCNALVKLYF